MKILFLLAVLVITLYPQKADSHRVTPFLRMQFNAECHSIANLYTRGTPNYYRIRNFCFRYHMELFRMELQYNSNRKHGGRK